MVSLVTGGSGFIGSHLVETLRKSRIETTSLDIKKDADVVADIRTSGLSKGLRPYYDEIHHLAGRPWAKVRDESRWHFESHPDFLTNSLGTQRVLTATDSDIFVFSSTANLYGNGRKFKEDSPFNISSPYGYSKAVAERIISLSGRRHVIFRFGTVVGSRGRCFPNLLVWSVVNGKAEKVEIFNNGNTYRDIVDVRDIVSAMMSASKLENDIYNISSGTEIRGPDLATIVDEEARKRGYDGLEFETTPFMAPGYVPESTLNISKILETGVWKPKYKLRDTITWLFDYYESAKDAPKPPAWDEL